jgi:hypothetical protein
MLLVLTVAEVTEDWLRKLIGAQADAAWLGGRNGVEYDGINAAAARDSASGQR